MRVHFWGTRGSIATPGPSTIHFGGNTSCVEITTAGGETLILDCGTGARLLGAELLARARRGGGGPLRLSLLMGHMHWDHIQGFPFFAPAFIPGNRIDVYAPAGGNNSLRQVLGGQMNFTYFPVELEGLPAAIGYNELGEGTCEIAGVRVSAQFLNHTSSSLGYRLECGGVSVVYLSDHEPFAAALWCPGAEPGRLDSILHAGDRRHAEFMEGADLVIHDAQYTPEEYAAKRNWGHSHYEYVTELAAAAGVRRLALTHHDPTHDDDFVSEIERRARSVAARRGGGVDVFCAFEGCAVELTPGAGMAAPSAVAPAADGAHSAAPVAPAAVGGAALLVVDDNEELRRLTRMVLEREGFRVREAADGAEAGERLREERPDLVLLDLEMPRVGGLEVLASMGADASLSDVPVLVVTGSNDGESLREVFATGAADYITKPYSTPQLLARVRACLARAARGGSVG